MKVIKETGVKVIEEPFIDVGDEETSAEPPKGAQTQIAGTERKEIQQINAIDEARRKLANERTSLQKKESELKSELWALLAEHQEELHERELEGGLEYVYRYTDASGKTRDIVWIHKETDKLEFRTAKDD